MQNLEKTGYMMLEATAYGDAAGLPVETWTAKDINTKYGWLDRLVSTADNPFFAGEHLAGVWSDDTQLSLAVAEGLIAADGFDLHTQATAFMKEYDATPRVEFKGKIAPRGWGGSTTHSAERLALGVEPHQSGESGGSGNGVLMKLAPLVFWQAARNVSAKERYTQYDALTTMTHDSDIARWATRVHGDFLLKLLTVDPATDAHSLAKSVINMAVHHENELAMDTEGSDILSYLLRKDLAGKPQNILQHTDGKGFYAPQTLAMAYGVFIHDRGNFADTVYQVVNLGGDTDSTGSIVANMLNFMQKGDIIMPNDASMIHQLDRLRTVSRQLTAVALQGAR